MEGRFVLVTEHFALTNLTANNIDLFSLSDGKFGAYMQVHIQNDGPVTISLETPPPKPVQEKQVKQVRLLCQVLSRSDTKL